MDLLELEVGEAAQGGWCVAREPSGRVVLVRHALPGERVLAQVTEATARFARADAVQVLAASPDRVEPPCPHARPGGCGGCDWQHASPAAQRRLKAAVISQQLRRIAGLDREVTVEPLPGDPAGLGWRTRVRFAVGPDGTAGLRKHRSHEVIDVGHCPIAHPLVDEAGVTGRPWPGAGSVQVVSAPGSGQRALVVTPATRSPGKSARQPGHQAGRGVQRNGRPGYGPGAGRGAGRAADRAARRAVPAAGRGRADLAGQRGRVLAGAPGRGGRADRGGAAGAAARSPGTWRWTCTAAPGLFAGRAGRRGRAVRHGHRHRVRRGPRSGTRGTTCGPPRGPGCTAATWPRCWPGPAGRRPGSRCSTRRGPAPGAAVLDQLLAPGTSLGRVAYVSCDPATLARDIGDVRRRLAGSSASCARSTRSR